MSSPNFLQKTRAVNLLMEELGCGRRVVENAMNKLEESGRIKIERDQYDTRVLRISLEDIERVRRAIKGEDPN